MSFVSSDAEHLAGYTVPSRIITETLVAPATTCAFVTMTPSLADDESGAESGRRSRLRAAEEHVERILRRLVRRLRSAR